MKLGRTRILAIALVILAAFIAVRVRQLATIGAGTGYAVGLVYESDEASKRPFIKAAYEEVLREEGIPHQWVSADEALLIDGASLAGRFPVLIFPDGLAQSLDPAMLQRAQQYVQAGGRLAVVFDAGVKDKSGIFRSGAVLAPLAGVDYMRYDTLHKRAYVQGSLHFVDPAAARYWNFPPGKLYGHDVVGGYIYGRLGYPIANAKASARDLKIFASIGGIPVLAERRAGAGSVLWVNLPLGYLKAYSDDLPLRVILRTFAVDHAAVPHLVPAPGGVGTVIVDWHVDSRIEERGIPNLIARRLIRPGIQMEFDITAGPDRDTPGDHLGFDACGRGRPLVRKLMAYGTIGSHGGWAHNWFASQLESGSLSVDQIVHYIKLNNDCLSSVTGTPIKSYAAPAGVHPQPIVTLALERLGMDAYYYTGDSGSPPDRTFSNGAMPSETVWAFPIMPNEKFASLGEMASHKLSPALVRGWLEDTLAYSIEQRSIRLVYSHPYDLLNSGYTGAFGTFLDDLAAAQKRGVVRTASMADVAGFEQRFIQTDFTFVRRGNEIDVTLQNPRGLHDISFAVPEIWLALGASVPAGLRPVGRSGQYAIYTVTTNATNLTAELSARN